MPKSSRQRKRLARQVSVVFGKYSGGSKRSRDAVGEVRSEQKIGSSASLPDRRERQDVVSMDWAYEAYSTSNLSKCFSLVEADKSLEYFRSD